MPYIPNTPGVIWRKTAKGWEARWQARTKLIKQGFTPKSVRLWSGADLDDRAIASIQDEANRLQTEMLIYGRGGLPQVQINDGTLAALAHSYQTDQDSPYHKTRYASRVYYDKLLSRLTRDHGDVALSEIKARLVTHWHAEWSRDRGVSMSAALVRMLRGIMNFGAAMLEDEQCERISGALGKLRFEMAKARTERLTADMAIAIRAKAHEWGMPSIALAQAFQFECMLRQKDVIGEWVPVSEPGISEVTHSHFKWLRGLRWEEIDDALILRHITSKRQKAIEAPLHSAPMVIEELRLMGRKASGPVIVCEETALPWKPNPFRYYWRQIATEVGVPTNVRNMDSRAGAITEATDAGAELEHIRHAATHSDISMTQRYSRGSAEKTAKVMQIRAEHRNKTRT